MFSVGLAGALGALLAGCSSSSDGAGPDLNAIYSDVAQRGEDLRNPVIVIPGILGSRLIEGETGQVVWGAFDSKFANPNDPEGLRTFALPMQQGAPLAQLTDPVVEDGPLDQLEVTFLGLPLKLRAYQDVLGALGVGGYRDESAGLSGVDYGDGHFTCFQFSYDWRRDNAENAARLSAFIEDKAAYVAAERKRRYGYEGPVRFDIVAHSMGGLVARYYLRYGDQPLRPGSPTAPSWAGAERVENLILVGTPGAGSIQAFEELITGKKYPGPIPDYPAAALGSFPSIYQLMPRERHGAWKWTDAEIPVRGIYDVETWERYRWGLLNPDQGEVLEALLPGIASRSQRQAIARDHLAKCLAQAEAFHTALDAPADPPEGTRIYLLAGDAAATPSVARLDRESGALVEIEDNAAGDGTVLRSSALVDERLNPSNESVRLDSPVHWHAVTFLFTDHLGMTKDPAFTDNVLFILLEK